jgi:hypothetical protein
LNSKKEELFKFFVQKDRDEESKRDEEAYLKAIVQKDQEETRKVDEQNYKRIQVWLNNSLILLGENANETNSEKSTSRKGRNSKFNEKSRKILCRLCQKKRKYWEYFK